MYIDEGSCKRTAGFDPGFAWFSGVGRPLGARVTRSYLDHGTKPVQMQHNSFMQRKNVRFDRSVAKLSQSEHTSEGHETAAGSFRRRLKRSV